MRSHEPASAAGTGAHFTSPPKKRDRKNKRVVLGMGQAQRKIALRERIDALRNPKQALPQAIEPAQNTHNTSQPNEDVEMEDWVDESSTIPNPLNPLNPPSDLPPIRVAISRPSNIRTPAERLCAAWDILLPKLEEPFAEYQVGSYAQRPSAISAVLRHECTASCGTPVVVTIQCLYISHFEEVQWKRAAACRPKPVSIDLLDIYHALFERSCDAITALAAALRTIYDRRGFYILSLQNPAQLAKDPFCAGLQNAVQWYSNLRSRLQAKVDQALAAADMSPFSPAPTPAAPDTSATSADPSAESAESAASADSDNAAAHSSPHADPPSVSINPESAPPAPAV
ncbi:hypothetical protein B0H13DRAFT_2303126 [Mycena leptocephala]|nr:hypothetical protein B0H13DRAFT_2303126 [Mycena leptocephala]